jgi:hypothetical protein
MKGGEKMTVCRRQNPTYRRIEIEIPIDLDEFLAKTAQEQLTSKRSVIVQALTHYQAEKVLETKTKKGRGHA